MNTQELEKTVYRINPEIVILDSDELIVLLVQAQVDPKKQGDDRKPRLRFQNELDIRINDAQRNLTSQHAQSLFYNLREARVDNEIVLKEVETRLFETLQQFAIKAEMIALTVDILQASMLASSNLEPTDNLILNCILNHAQENSTEVKVLLSGNSNDFGKREVQAALQDVGINHYFASTETFLNWLK
jgi:uncharacterized protein